MEDWEDLVEVSIPLKEVEERPEVDLTDPDPWGLAEHYRGVKERSDAWAETHRNVFKARRLPPKKWKTINRCKETVTSIGIIKMMYEKNMVKRWSKTYKQQFPTWHAIGTKWQRQLDVFVQDVVGALRRSKEGRGGGISMGFWEDGCATVARRVIPTILKRHHTHLGQILASMIEDRQKLDWGRNDIHIGL